MTEIKGIIAQLGSIIKFHVNQEHSKMKQHKQLVRIVLKDFIVMILWHQTHHLSSQENVLPDTIVQLRLSIINCSLVQQESLEFNLQHLKV